MSTQVKTLEQAAAEIAERQQQQRAAEQAITQQKEEQQRANILDAFRTRYAALLPLLEASGITVAVESSESEDVWADICFYGQDGTRSSYAVTNSGARSFELNYRDLSDEELTVSLSARLAPKKSPVSPAPVATTPAQPTCAYLGREAAFARPIGSNGATHYEDRDTSRESDGLTKLEYFAGQALAGMLAHPGCAGATTQTMAQAAVAQAKCLLAELAAA